MAITADDLKYQDDDVEAPPKIQLRRWTVNELLETEFPEPKWAVPGLIPEGLTIIGGRPKVGKSWLLLQLAHAIGTGGEIFGEEVIRGRVLFLALEDNPRRLQSRMRKHGIPKDAEIEFFTEWKPLHKGGIVDLFREIEAVDYRLVVVDTFTRAFRGMDQNDQPIVSEIMDELQSKAINSNIAATFSDHTGKNSLKSDPIDDIMNSTAKTAAADVVLAIYKEMGKSVALLKGRGRDIEEVDLTLEWEFDTCTWRSAGNTKEIRMTENRKNIIETLRRAGGSEFAPLQKATGIEKGSLWRTLEKMVDSGVVQIKEKKGKVYYFANTHKDNN
jgi:RecA-family ATPase